LSSTKKFKQVNKIHAVSAIFIAITQAPRALNALYPCVVIGSANRQAFLFAVLVLLPQRF
jgi:hypothetical protein